MSTEVKLEDIVSLAKRRGFIYQGSDVYGGLSGTWDYGPLGVALKRNIMNLWWQTFVENRDDMYGVDAAILMNQKVWQASGHTKTFTDPMVECGNCSNKFRADKIDISKCPSCGKENTFRPPVDFNLMFNTQIGASWGSIETPDGQHWAGELTAVENKTGEEKAKVPITEGDSYNGTMMFEKTGRVYLRPETAQGIFTNYKNVLDSFYPDLPFGIAQQGKAFRNEISPRDFVFRSREFEQMEIEYFVHKDNWQEEFKKWEEDIEKFLEALGLPENSYEAVDVPAEDRAHYSEKTLDYEFKFPHGKDELLGLAYRTDFDLKNIDENSGKSMEYRVKGTNETFIPHVIEPSFGVERALMAVLTSAYRTDELNGEQRIYLALPEHLAPVKYAVSPLLKNKPELVEKAREVYQMLKKKYGAVMWDDNGNIGKRYRRQDEIGTPHCVVIDFETLENNTVTVRDRDTTEQKRIVLEEI